MSATSVSKLFQRIKVGTNMLQHRAVLAPMTRYRATRKAHVPIVPLVGKYYDQRSSQAGTLFITEATLIHPRAGGIDSAPGIRSKEQISAWKQVTDKVHSNGSFIFVQLQALGRAAEKALLDSESLPYIAPSAIPLSGHEGVPREFTTAEIKDFVQLFVQAAKNVVFEAGFDGVEMHGANGYLIDQFLQDVSNQWTDAHDGSVENRCCFALEVIDAVSAAIGEERTAIRMSPWVNVRMKMKDPVPQYTHLVSSIKKAHPSLAYIHITEARIPDASEADAPVESNDFVRAIWSPRPLISASGYERESTIQTADEKGDLIAFGRHFIANPDLPRRLEKNLLLNPYDRNTFYTHGYQPGTEHGYRLSIRSIRSRREGRCFYF